WRPRHFRLPQRWAYPLPVGGLPGGRAAIHAITRRHPLAWLQLPTLGVPSRGRVGPERIRGGHAGDRAAGRVGGAREDVDVLQVRGDRVLPDVSQRAFLSAVPVKADVGERLVVILHVHHQRGSELALVGEATAHPGPLSRL